MEWTNQTGPLNPLLQLYRRLLNSDTKNGAIGKKLEFGHLGVA